MDLFFPIVLTLLLILFLMMNFEWVATVLSYVLMIGLIALVAVAIGYGIYEKLGPEVAILLGFIVAGVLCLTRIGYALAAFLRGFIEGYRTGSAGKA